MENMGGLIELVLVFAFVLGYAVLELMSLRRHRKREAAKDAAREDADVLKPDR